jgi:hypothetical protein
MYDMYEDMYSLAKLMPDEIEEIREVEQRLTTKKGQAISLIAYQADIVDGTPD